MNKLKKRFFLGLLFLVVIAVLHLFLNGNIINLLQVQQHREFLQNFIQNRYILSVLLYLLIFICAAVLSIPITVLLTVAAGYFFGVWAGLLYANIGATVGAMISFLLFRYLLGDFVQNRYADRLAAFNREIEAHGPNYLLTMQLLPFTPTLLINIFAGMSQIRLWTFIWTTSLGILPGSLIYTLSGQHLAQISSLRDLVSARSVLLLILLALLALVPIFFKWRNGRRG